MANSSLTARLLGVALLDVPAGFPRVQLAAIRTAEGLQMSAEGLQRGVDSGVRAQGGRLLIGEGFVLIELRKMRRLGSHVVL